MPVATRRPVPDRLPPLQLPDLAGRRMVITGATSGIGLESAIALAQARAALVLGVRDVAKGEAAADRIRERVPSARVAVEQIELGSLASVADFALRVGSSPVDVLISNAGLSTADASARTEDGFDLQIGVNYLGSFALVAGLWPALVAAQNPRVVTLGSLMAHRGRIDPDFGRPRKSTYRSYSDSKLGQVVLAMELRRRSRASGTGVEAVAAHPGWSQTAIFDTAGPPAVVETIGNFIGALQSPADGAQPVLLAATAPRPSMYYGPTRWFGAAGPAGPSALPKGARTAGAAERLWRLSTELTGVEFEP